MKTDLLFHSRRTNPYIDSTPPAFYKLDKLDSNQRELSPWSSEENRFLKPQNQLKKAKLDNTRINHINERYQEKAQLDPPLKGRSLQLKPLKNSQLSDEFVRLVRRQKRKVGSKDPSECIALSHNRPIGMIKDGLIQMDDIFVIKKGLLCLLGELSEYTAQLSSTIKLKI